MFSKQQGEAARDEAIQRVEEAADEDFKSAAIEVIEFVARTTPRFTTDRVWYFITKRGITPPREPRVLGALMRKAAGRGWIEATNEHRLSTKSSNHRRPIRVWRSVICPEATS